MRTERFSSLLLPQEREDLETLIALTRCARRRNSQVAIVLAVVLISLASCFVPRVSKSQQLGSDLPASVFNEDILRRFVPERIGDSSPSWHRNIRTRAPLQGGGLAGRSTSFSESLRRDSSGDRSGRILSYRGGASNGEIGANASNARGVSGRGKDDDEEADGAAEEGENATEGGHAGAGEEGSNAGEGEDATAQIEEELRKASINENDGQEQGEDDEFEDEAIGVEDDGEVGDVAEDDENEEDMMMNVEEDVGEENEVEDYKGGEEDGDGVAEEINPDEVDPKRKLEIDIPEESLLQMERDGKRRIAQSQNITSGEFTIHLHRKTFMRSSVEMPWQRRTRRAGIELRKWAKKVFHVDEVKIDPKLNEHLWSRGKKHTPLRVRVRLDKVRRPSRFNVKVNKMDPEKWYAYATHVHVDSFHHLLNQCHRGGAYLIETATGNLVSSNTI
mmetsp:Transcript_24327/g.58711  ORF Transcript_24327/g.58711 Transcript_24327/m.58711 type:complete len:447 (-) Transcript_24327:346-1686(-)